MLDFLNLRKLDNLDELQRLDTLEQMEQLDQLRHLDKLDRLEQLDQLNQMDQLQHLDQLQRMEQLGELELLQYMHQLDELRHLEQMGQLDQLNTLENLAQLDKLNQLDRMSNLGQLDRLQQLDQLGQLHHVQNLQEMSQLQHLTQLNHLSKLSKLDQLNQLGELQRLHQLQDLQNLDRLSILDPVAQNLRLETGLFILSALVPGLVFQEALSLASGKRLGWRRALVWMIAYNVLSLLAALWIMPDIRSIWTPMAEQPGLYYAAWLIVLLGAPALIGGILGWLARARFAKSVLLGRLFSAPARQVSNAWGRFLTEAESYHLVITLNNEEKIRAVFHQNAPTPPTSDPDDLYVTETARYNPELDQWHPREQPVGLWVKGSAIKTVELQPEP